MARSPGAAPTKAKDALAPGIMDIGTVIRRAEGETADLGRMRWTVNSDFNIIGYG